MCHLHNLPVSKLLQSLFIIFPLTVTLSLAVLLGPAATSQADTGNPWSFYSHPAKMEIKATGQYRLQANDIIYGVQSGTPENVLATEIKRLTSLETTIKTPEQATTGGGISIGNGTAAGLPVDGRTLAGEIKKLTPIGMTTQVLQQTTTGRGIFIERGTVPGLPAEGFEIVTTADKLTIRGANERACLYGVYAFMGRLRNESGMWMTDCGTIKDWPDISIRGVCMELLPPAIRDVALAKRYLDAFSRAGANLVIFNHHPKQIRSWLKNVDGGWTRAQMSELAQYARSLQMDVWGGMGSVFNAADFPEMEIKTGTNLYNPLKEASYDYLFSLYEQILQAYQPSTLMISHDEIKGLSVYGDGSGMSTADILAADVKRIHDWLGQRNVRTAMWGDMFLDYATWEPKVGSAGSQRPSLNSGATDLALQKIPLDVLILDWHYAEKTDYASIGYFRNNGFSVLGALWYNPKVAKVFSGSVNNYGGQGLLATDWGFWRTLSPSATTLYGPLCGWSTQCIPDQTNNDVAALAATARDPVYTDVFSAQNAADLSASVNKPSSTGGSGRGLFDLGSILDLRGFPTGNQVLGGISFYVLPDNGGQQNNCVVVAKGDTRDAILPVEKEVFQGSAAAKAVAFLQTCFLEEPRYRVRKIGQYVVTYENGRTLTVNLLEDWNITDVRSSEGLRINSWSFTRSPDILIGSKLVWNGVSGMGIPTNVQAYVWQNPYPADKIRSIRLSAAAAPANSRIALLGLTFLE